MESIEGQPGEGLICAKGALSEMDGDVDEMLGAIYEDREKSMDREVSL